MSTFDTTRFAEAVRTKRGEKSLRVVAAEISAISPNTVLHIEQGTLTPDTKTILRVCTWLGSPLSDFLKLEGVRMPDYKYPRPLYDVALWRWWPSEHELSITDYIEADSPLLAALRLMQRHKLPFVGRAAVASPNRSIERWSGLRLETYLLPQDEQEESEVQL